MTKIQVRKQFTTVLPPFCRESWLFSIWRRYKFESNSQLTLLSFLQPLCCFQYDEDTSSKAIHNGSSISDILRPVVFNMTKIQVRKQFTTGFSMFPPKYSCFQYDEDTSSKAIHNRCVDIVEPWFVVFNMTKIQVRKQFTTAFDAQPFERLLFSIWRRYKFESNSQLVHTIVRAIRCCFQYDEDTSSKAIHNSIAFVTSACAVVFNMTKIQVRKQFTTKDVVVGKVSKLFSIWRRYKFESNSQPLQLSCLQKCVVFNMTKIQVRKQFTT